MSVVLPAATAVAGENPIAMMQGERGTAAATAHEIADLWTEALVERHAFDGGKIVVSEWPKSPTVAVCVASPNHDGERFDDLEREIDRRGGTTELESGTFGATWCVTLPSTEVGFAVWLAARQFAPTRSAGEPPELPPSAVTSDERLSALSLEGTSLSGNPSSNPVIAVSGGVEPSEVIALFRRFSGKPTRDAGVDKLALAIHQSSERLSVLEAPVPAPRARYGWIASGDARHRAALRVAVRVLAGDTSARLRRELVMQRYLAHSVSSWSSVVPGGAMIGIDVEISTRTSLDRARRFIDGAVKRMRLVGPTHGELTRAKRALTRSALLDWENPTRRARNLATYDLAQGDAHAWLEELSAIGNLTEESVRKAAHDGLVDARRTTVEIYPPLWPEDDPKLSRYRVYTVEPGDSITEVAARFGVTVPVLAGANDLDPKYRLAPGQTLLVPPSQ
jgi:hypothetical protein